jgi:hypothetical protein
MNRKQTLEGNWENPMNPNDPNNLEGQNPVDRLVPEQTSEHPEQMGVLKIGIVGHGFVGGAVDYAFTHPDVQKFYVDPKHGTTLDDLIAWSPHLTFICAPTPMNPETGFVDASIVEDATLRCFEDTEGAVIIKSTITPDVIDRIANSVYENDMKRLCYNPEFLTESNAKEQFVNAPYHVLGGHPQCTSDIEQIYSMFSLCTTDKFVHLSAPEAAFVKYGVNSFLATKVTFFNQLYDTVAEFGCNWPSVANTIGMDSRIGVGHTRVPGYDGKRGFGGACFPKDLVAFNNFDKKNLTLLAEVDIINKNYRTVYDLDDREKANNITFGKPKEEIDPITERVQEVSTDNVESDEDLFEGEMNVDNGQTEEKQ